MSMQLLTSNDNLATTKARSTQQRKGAALRLVSTHQLQRQEWLQVRRTGIGSSDAAAAVGLNPYQSQLELWMHKTGKAAALPEVDPQDDTHPMFWGTVLEPIVAMQYAKRTGRKVRRINAVLQHPEHPWMLANIDREVVSSSEVQLLECKTAGVHGARLWKDGVPEYVQLQVMHQLAVTGYQAADVAVLIGGQELRVFRIVRNDALIAQLITLEERFWGYVQRNEEPPADGSESAESALRHLYPTDNANTLDLSSDQEMSEVFRQLLAVREAIALHSAQEAQLKQRIQQRMQDAARAVFTHGEVSWKRSKDSTMFDTTRLQKEHPELLKDYALSKPGARRFLVHV